MKKPPTTVAEVLACTVDEILALVQKDQVTPKENLTCTDCTKCTGCVNCSKCTACVACARCVDCSDCVGIQDAKGLQFVVYGVQLTEAEYRKWRAA